MNAQYKLEKHLIDLDEFANQLARCMHCSMDPEKAKHAFKAVFGAIRNRFTFEESLQFIDMLPLTLKAIYLDGWHIGVNMPEPPHSMEELIDDIVTREQAESNWYNSSRDELRNIIKAIFQIIGTHVAQADMDKSMSFLPMDMQQYLRQGNLEVENTYTDTSIWLS